MESRTSSETRVERTRTFTGCMTCRGRHLKCDEAQPVCNTCRRLGIECAGYGPRLFWTPETVIKRQLRQKKQKKQQKQQKHRCSVYRFPLFSEDDRASMTFQLSESLGSKSAKQILTDVELLCEQLKDNGKPITDLRKGPFGVFQATRKTPSASSSPENASFSMNTNMEADSTPQESPKNIPDDCLQPWLDDFSQTNFDLLMNSLDCSTALASQFGDLDYVLLSGDNEAHELLPNEPPEEQVDDLLSLPNIDPVNSTPSPKENLQNNDIDKVDVSMSDLETTPRSEVQSFIHKTSVPEYADVLLRHYKLYVENALTMHAQRKSPWQIILLPCALETFAGLFIWSGASHTRSALLYELLAQSAFQLHTSNELVGFPQDLQELGTRYQAIAKHHLRAALQDEVFGESQAKYQELLMAVLAMAMISLQNERQCFKSFLLDAEQLIRLRGLPQKKTYEIRVLHHMYTHLRVIAESISLPCNEITDSKIPDIVSNITDGRKFRIAENSLNMGLDPMHKKASDVAYNDIHLEVQGLWTETLYADIYGVPESLMTLLSQTIFFANEKVRLAAVAQSDPKISMAIAHHLKSLEDTVLSWSLDTERTNLGREVADLPFTYHMTNSIHSAIIIYFYRRIYNLNAKMLQDRVRKTLDHLEPCLEQSVNDSDFAMTLAWPAFIAACEAMDSDLQERALKCLAITDCRDILLTSKPASELVMTVWGRREKERDWTLSWLEVLQEYRGM